MFVKNFRGKTAEACIQQLKNEMGKDAVILQSRTIRPIFGRFGPAIHEIVAATGLNTVIQAPPPDPEPVEVAPAPKLTMTSGASTGRTAYSQANSGSGRLSLAEAAELAERGDFNRLVDAGVISERARRTMSNSSAAMRLDTEYAQPTESDNRLQQLEKQIAQLTQVLESKNREVIKPAAPRTGFLKYGVAAEPLATKQKTEAASEPIDPYQSLVDMMKRAQMADGLIRHVREELRPGQTLEDAKNQLQEVLTRRSRQNHNNRQTRRQPCTQYRCICGYGNFGYSESCRNPAASNLW
jgi:flagellar biosynthesis GTPase FlhF